MLCICYYVLFAQAKDDRLAFCLQAQHMCDDIAFHFFFPLLHHNKLLRSHVVYYSLLFSF